MGFLNQNCPDPIVIDHGVKDGVFLLGILLAMKAGVQLYRLSVRKQCKIFNKDVERLEARVSALENLVIKKEFRSQPRLLMTKDATTQTETIPEDSESDNDDVVMIE